jgi:hypothetical protein
VSARESSCRVEGGERVVALSAWDTMDGTGELVVQVGTLRFVGRPAAVVDLLGRALRECFVAYGNGTPNKRSFLPLTEPSEVGGARSRVAVATAKPLALEGVTSISDHLAPAGGGIRISVFRMNEGDDD